MCCQAGLHCGQLELDPAGDPAGRVRHAPQHHTTQLGRKTGVYLTTPVRLWLRAAPGARLEGELPAVPAGMGKISVGESGQRSCSSIQ